MRALVTGGAGFIGSHLSERLAAEGNAVTVLDDLSTGTRENLDRLAGTPGFRFVEGSAADPGIVAELVAEADGIFHLAAAVGVRLIVERPVHTIETNIHGTETVLREAAGRRIPVVLTSTSEVYGKGTKVPFSEDDDLILGPTIKARWSYACSKAIDEFLALAHHRERGLPVVVVRLFNTVGPRQVGRYGMVIPRLVGQALGGEDLTVYGDGRQTRCFSHVLDAVEALLRLSRCPPACGRVFNVGSTEEISIMDLARLVVRLTGGAARIRLVPYGEAYAEGFEDMMRRVPDVTRLVGAIGFAPRRGIEEIVRDVIGWMQGSAS